MRRTIHPLLALLLLGNTACSDATAPPTETPADEVVRPTAVQALELAATAFTMPTAWQADGWHVVVHPDGRVLAGDTSGLYLLGEEIEQIDTAPVHGLLTHDELGFVIVSAEGIKVFDDELYDSAINDMLEGVTVRGVARRGAELWLVTDGELYELEGGALASYPELVAVDSLRTHDDASYLVADIAGAITLLRDEDGALSAQSLSDELADMVLAAPGPHGRLLSVASADRRLFERVAVEGGVAWLPVALTADEADGGALGVDGVVADPIGGSLWLTQGLGLARVDGGGVVSTIAWPDGISAPGHLVATADGAVWMAENDLLVRVGPESPPPSYEQHVVPFYEANCAKCHEAGGEVATVTRFGDYDGFAASIEDIMQQVEAGLMPTGDNTLAGDPELPRKWRDGGMRP